MHRLAVIARSLNKRNEITNVPSFLLSTKTSASKKLGVEEAKAIFRKAQAVCFDVDSTVITEEGIDVLAEYCGAGAAVAEMTRKAMGGTMLFHDALEARLKLIQPTKTQLEEMQKKHPLVISTGMQDLVDKLHSRNQHVYLVSGGFRQMINPVADILGISRERIYANEILFDPKTGKYAGFNRSEPTSRAGGKAAAVKILMEKHGYKDVIMIGDGATDMEARPPAKVFIGYGGIVIREPIRAGADWFVTSMQELINELN